MSDQASGATARRPKKRSPSYPSVDLERAVGRARQLWEKEKQYATPVESVVKIWGYASLNGPAGLTVAALKKFGLLTDEGVKADRRVQITDLGVEILSHPDPAKQLAAIRRAALAPSAHREMWERYGSHMPSDDNVIWHLTREGGFSDTGAREFVRVYKQTIDFARLEEDGLHEDADYDEDALNDREPTAPPTAERDSARFTPATEDFTRPGDTVNPPDSPNLSQAGRTISIPLLGGQEVTVRAAFPISSANWSHMMTVLEAMKPGLVDDS